MIMNSPHAFKALHLYNPVTKTKLVLDLLTTAATSLIIQVKGSSGQPGKTSNNVFLLFSLLTGRLN